MIEKNACGAHPAKKRVLIVDDHPLMRDALARLINLEGDLEVCSQASNAREAIQLISLSVPDLAVVDISLEGKSGLELIKDIRAMNPNIFILVMSMHDEALYTERALRAGARGYVSKKAGADAVRDALHQVLNGKIYVSSSMSDKILELFSAAPGQKAVSPIHSLTDREFEVFKLIGEGCTTREIARRLHISTKTVDVYRQHLKDKLDLPSSTSLIQHAIRWVESQNRS